MRDLARNSSSASCSRSNISHKLQKNVSDISTDNFSKTGLSEEPIPKKDEEKENEIHGW